MHLEGYTSREVERVGVVINLVRIGVRKLTKKE